MIVEGTSVGPVAVMLRLGRGRLVGSLLIRQKLECEYCSLAEDLPLVEAKEERIVFQLAAVSWLRLDQNLEVMNANHVVVLRLNICSCRHTVHRQRYAAHARKDDGIVEAYYDDVCFARLRDQI